MWRSGTDAGRTRAAEGNNRHVFFAAEIGRIPFQLSRKIVARLWINIQQADHPVLVDVSQSLTSVDSSSSDADETIDMFNLSSQINQIGVVFIRR